MDPREAALEQADRLIAEERDKEPLSGAIGWRWAIGILAAADVLFLAVAVSAASTFSALPTIDGIEPPSATLPAAATVAALISGHLRGCHA